jgi:hypothetical protein
MKLSPIQIVSSFSSLTKAISATFGIPLFDAVDTGNTVTFENVSLISALRATIEFSNGFSSVLEIKIYPSGKNGFAPSHGHNG